MTYTAWIKAYVIKAACTTGLKDRCREACRDMRKAFPELTAVPGAVTLADGRRIVHWWLIDAAGTVWDPTALQFDSEPVAYTSLAEEEPRPAGQCLECAGYRYNARSGYCSARCARARQRRHRKQPELRVLETLSFMAALMEPRP